MIFAARFPEKVSVYVGSGQVGDWAAGEWLSYAFRLAEAGRRTTEGVEEAARIGPPPYAAKSLFVKRTAVDGLRGGWAWRSGRLEQHCWPEGILDLRSFQTSAGLRVFRSTPCGPRSRAESSGTGAGMKIACGLLPGTPGSLGAARDQRGLLRRIAAPSKKLLWFERSGHEPFMDEPDEFNSAMVELVRPLASFFFTARRHRQGSL